MKAEERLRLFDALLGEGLAVADGEAGDTETVRRWASRVAAARRQYREDVENAAENAPRDREGNA